MSQQKRTDAVQGVDATRPKPAAHTGSASSASKGASPPGGRPASSPGSRTETPAARPRGAVAEGATPSVDSPRPQTRGAVDRDQYRPSADLSDEHAGGGERRNASVSAIIDAHGVETEPPPELHMPSGLSQKARVKAQKWYDGLERDDQKFYSDYLSTVPAGKRAKTVELMQRIDDRYVSDPGTRNAMRKRILDEGQSMRRKDIEFMREVVITDDAHKSEAVKRERMIGEGGQSAREVKEEVASYNSDNRKVIFSTDLLALNGKQQKEIVTHEMGHPSTQQDLESTHDPTQDRSIVYGLQMRKSFRDVASLPGDRRHTVNVLGDLYGNLGYPPEVARDKAQHAVSHPHEYITSYRSLYRDNPQMQDRLARLDPGMARLMDQEAHFSVPTDKEFLRDLDVRQFERDQGFRPGSMRAYYGHTHDDDKHAQLTSRLERLSHVNTDGTFGSGTEVEEYRYESGSSTPHDVHGHEQPVAPGSPTTGSGTSSGSAPSPPPEPSSGSETSTPGDIPPSGETPTAPPSSTSSGSPSPYVYDTTSSYSYQTPPTTTGADTFGTPLGLDPTLDPSLAGIEVSANMVDLNQDGLVNAKDQVLFDQIRQGSTDAEIVSADPQKLLETMLARKAEGRDLTAPSPAAAPFTKDTPEMRLMQGTPVPLESGTEAAPLPPSAPRLDRSEIETLVGEAYVNIQSGKVSAEEVDALMRASTQPEGAMRVADVLESTITGNEGGARLTALLDAASASPDSARAMAQTLSNVAAAAPSRTVGTLLLATDAGCHEAISRLFATAAEDKQGALHLASFFEAATREPDAARGMGELLDTLTEPQDGDRGGSQRVASTFSDATRWVGGAKDVSQGFVQLLDTEGGSRSFARLMHRFTGTAEGTESTGQMLRRMSFDQEGTQAVGTLLTRATASRDGARQVLDALHRVAASETGKRDVSVVLQRISEQPNGARFLANVTAHDKNVEAFSGLLDRLAESDGSRTRVAKALENVTRTGGGTEVGRLATRAQTNEALKTSLTRFSWHDPGVQAAPAVPLLTEGLEAQVRSGEPTAPGFAHRPVALPTSSHLSADRPVETRADASAQRPAGTAPHRIDSAGGIRGVETQAASAPSPQSEPRLLLGFRPSDIYAEDTLRKARICPDCGFRLSNGGACLRCVAFEQRGTTPPPTVARIQDV